jgi:hypothetical protein
MPSIKKLLPKLFLGAPLTNVKVTATKVDEIITAVNIPKVDVINATDSSLTLTAEQSGRTVILDRAAGVDVTLPSASTANIGVYYEFAVKTTVTSNDYSINGASTSDLLMGGIVSLDDTAPEVMTLFKPDVTDDDVMSMNGTTTGGKIGTFIRVKCVAANRWLVEGTVSGSGVLATPFL